ncbi:histidine kinase N-terminal 7TM domain-containing protein [Candidatus Margulisiibacteriota bacterium]
MSLLFITSVLSIIFNVSIGVFVFLKNRRSITNIVFSLFILGIALWIFGDIFYFTGLINIASPVFWVRLAHIGAVFTPALFVHFIYAFTQYKFSRKFLFSLYLGSFGLLLINIFTPYFIAAVEYNPALREINVSAGPFYAVFLLMIVVLLFHSYGVLIRRFRESQGHLTEQIRYYFIATGAIILAIIFCFPPMFGIKMPRLDNLFQVVYTSIVAYAILQHRLMNIEVVIRKTAVYSTLTALLTGFFISAILIGNYFLSSYLGQYSLWMAVGAAFAVALIFQPLREKTQNLVDKLFFKDKYNYRETLKNLAQISASIIDLDQLLGLVTKNVTDTLKVDRASLYIFKEDKNSFVLEK